MKITRRRTSAVLGLLAVGLSLLPVQQLLDAWLSWGRQLEFVPYGIAILACRFLLAMVGLLLVVLGPGVKAVAKAGLLLVSLAIGLTLGECFLRLVYDPPLVTCGWRGLSEPHLLNEVGFRGQSLTYDENNLVVVLLGDSQVEASACGEGRTPEARLQHHLNALPCTRPCKVFTIGAGGYGQDQQLLALNEYYRGYRADAVVLWQTFSNDIWNNIFPTHWPANGRPKPTYRLVGEEIIGPGEQLGQTLSYRSSFRLLDLLRNRQVVKADRDGLWEQYLPSAYQPLRDYAGPVLTDWQHRWDHDLAGIRTENLATEKSHLTVSLIPRSPRMQYGLDLTHGLLQRIESTVESAGADFAVFDVVAPGACDPDGVYSLNGNYYRVSRQQREANLNYVNEDLRWISIPVTTPDWRVGPRDSHLNEDAVDQVMRELAVELARAFDW